MGPSLSLFYYLKRNYNMTTLAFNRTSVAIDSRITDPGVIYCDEACKFKLVHEEVLFCVGDAGKQSKLFTEYTDNNVTADSLVGARLYVFSKRDRTLTEFYETKGTVSKYVYNNSVAFGSGGKFALGALDAGVCVNTALDIAKKRDLLTGGKTHTFHAF
jgi:hypothetical protein